MTPLTLEASGRALRTYAWVERRLFEVIGSWSGDTREPRGPTRAGGQRRPPRLAGPRPRRPVAARPRARGRRMDRSAQRGGGECLSVMAEPGPDETAARLVGVYRVVVPGLVTAFEDHTVAPPKSPTDQASVGSGSSSTTSWPTSRRGVELLNREDESVSRRPPPATGRSAGRGRRLSWRFRAVQNASGDEQSGTSLLPSDPISDATLPDDRATPPRSRRPAPSRPTPTACCGASPGATRVPSPPSTIWSPTASTGSWSGWSVTRPRPRRSPRRPWSTSGAEPPPSTPSASSAITWVLTLAHRRAVDRVRSAQAAGDRERKVAVRDTPRGGL